MLIGVTGPLGCGKSWFAVRKIVEALEKDKVVITNFDLQEDWVELVVDHALWRWVVPGHRAKLKERWRRNVHVVREIDELCRIRIDGCKEARARVVIEEGHTFINARDWHDSERKEVVAWASKVRHLGEEVFIVTQDLQSIDRQIRAKMTYHVELRNLRQWKVAGIPIVPFNYFIAIWRYPTGKAVVKRDFYMLDWRKRLYDTHELGVWGEEGREDLLWLPRPPVAAPAGPPAGRTAGPPAGRTPAASTPDGATEELPI